MLDDAFSSSVATRRYQPIYIYILICKFIILSSRKIVKRNLSNISGY